MDRSESHRPEEIAETLRGAGSVVVIWGDRIGREGEGATAALLDVAAALNLAGQDGSGLLEVPEVTNARGLREAGCLPDAGPGLSAMSGRFSTSGGENRRLVGKATEEIRAALESGELKTLLLFGVDPLRDFPDTEAWKRALAAADHIVAFSMFETATTAMADVVFPLETHAEKDGTVTHPDGRLQRVRPSASRPGDIRPNWGVLAELSLALGHDTGVSSQPSAFAALADAVPFYSGITDADIGGRGIRWQEVGARRAASERAEERRGRGQLRGRTQRGVAHRGRSGAARQVPPRDSTAISISSASTVAGHLRATLRDGHSRYPRTEICGPAQLRS